MLVIPFGSVILVRLVQPAYLMFVIPSGSVILVRLVQPLMT